MMAASSGFIGAPARHSNGSRSTHETTRNPDDATDDEFGSFTAAERLSDPFGDVYGAEADFGDFAVASRGQEPILASSEATKSFNSMSNPPLRTPAVTTASLALVLTSRGEIDPFADITGGLGATVDTGEDEKKENEVIRDVEGDLMTGRTGAAPVLTSSATSAILDLVWGNTSQKNDVNPLQMPATSVGSGGRSRTASNCSGPTSANFVPFPLTAVKTPEDSTDLLSFSPVQSPSPIDPFIGIDDDTSGLSTAAPAFDSNELLTVTATPPLSSTSLSAPTSLRGSCVLLYDDVQTPGLSPFTSGSTKVKVSPRGSFAECPTRSFRSLSSSFVSAGELDNVAGQNGMHASFSTFSRAILKATLPSSAPTSLRSSLTLVDEFPGFARVGNDLNKADSFAEAGLVAQAKVPLAEALAAWNTDAGHVTDEDGSKECVRKHTDEEDAGEKYELAADALKTDVGSASVIVGKNDISDVLYLTKPAEVVDCPGDWTIASERNQAFDDSFSMGHRAGDVTVLCSPSTAMGSDVGDDKNTANVIFNDKGNEIHVVGLQGATVEGDIGVIDKGDAAIAANDNIASPVELNSVDVNGDSFDRSQNDALSFTTATMDMNAENASLALCTGDLENECSLLHQDKSHALATSAPIVFTDRRNTLNGLEVNDVVETTKQEGPIQATEVDDSDDFGDFGGFEAASATTVMAITISDASPWGSFPAQTTVPKVPIEDVDAVGDCAVSVTTSAFTDTTPVGDGFGDFTQSTEPSGDSECGNFGNFEQSSTNNGDTFVDFQQSCAETFGEIDNGFGDFAPAVAPAVVATPVLLVPSLSKYELSAFFKEALPTKPLSMIWPDQPESSVEVESTHSFQEKSTSTDFIHEVFRETWGEYISIAAARCPELSSSPDVLASSAEPKETDEHVDRNTRRASKYLNYILSEKIQEASKQNGVFSHGSERHQMYVGFAASGDADRMCAALKELQDALFHFSVNKAMMRFAKQAALSAKAKIAEQAAQQQAHLRGGSLFSTTRHLLSRGGNSGGAHGPSSNSTDSKSDHVGADTPTGVSVQKLARFSFTSNHDDSGNAHRGANNVEERVSDGSDHTGHSSGSDTDAASSADSRTRSQPVNSGSGNGGLMKKFQNRFSFASSRHRPRFVSLRRKGQSGGEVRKMELNLDAISGGLDEVKWKCALFLYDVDEVTHVAPSQISISAYPSKQPLTGKTDRSALTKLVKSDTIWTVDIGVNNGDMLNEW